MMKNKKWWQSWVHLYALKNWSLLFHFIFLQHICFQFSFITNGKKSKSRRYVEKNKFKYVYRACVYCFFLSILSAARNRNGLRKKVFFKKMPSECETARIAMVYIQPVGNYTLQVSCTSIYKPLIVLCSTLLLDTCTRVELKHIITTGLDDDDLLLLTYTISCYFLAPLSIGFRLRFFFSVVVVKL